MYALLADEYSPVALLVLGRDGLIRHVNQTMALLLGPSGRTLTNRPLAQAAPDVHTRLLPLIESVLTRGRPRRMAGITLPLPEPNRREQFWDAFGAPEPTDPPGGDTTPETNALGL